MFVLLSAGTDKMSPQWQGPYSILRKVSPVSYEIDLTNCKKRCQFYVNMLLKSWSTPSASVQDVVMVEDGGNLDIPLVEVQG